MREELHASEPCLVVWRVARQIRSVTESDEIPMQTVLPLHAVRGVAMDVQEFQRFYAEKFESIYRYVYSKVGNREEAEDLTSEIFLKAARRIDQQRSPQSMHYWLFLIARTTLADYWRAYYRKPKASLDELLEAGWEGPVEDEPT